MKIEDNYNYIPSKSKYNTCPEEKKNILACIQPLQLNGNHQEADPLPIVSNFNLTLGIKDTLSNLNEKATKFKRKKEPLQKENNKMGVKGT